MHTFRDMATAAYCPRKLYYRHRDPAADEETSQVVHARQDLAFRYPELLESDPEIQAAPTEVTPTEYRSRLGRLQATLDAWEDLVNPAGREVMLKGRECRGVAHKVLEGPPRPSLVFAGSPPEQGVWEPQTIRLVAAAKALAWERETTVETAFAEYPSYGIVREVPLTTRRKATYRSAIRTAESIDGPPSRTSNRQKCSLCEYQDRCGVVTRSLKSMLSGRRARGGRRRR